MKKLLFAASILISLLCSCGKEDSPTPTPTPATPDKVVISLTAPFSYKMSDNITYTTSFDSLNVKIAFKLDGETIKEESVTASNGLPWKITKELSLAGKKSIDFELSPEFSLKDESNLPTDVNLMFDPTGTFTFYKEGEVVPAGSKVQIKWGHVGASGFNARRAAEEKGIDAVKKFLASTNALGISKGTIAW